jgi:hypothetical protein
MPSPVYQNMANLVMGLPIGRCPSKFMNITMWEHRTFGSKIFGCGKVDYSDSIIISQGIKFSLIYPSKSFMMELGKELIPEIDLVVAV